MPPLTIALVLLAILVLCLISWGFRYVSSFLKSSVVTAANEDDDPWL